MSGAFHSGLHGLHIVPDIRRGLSAILGNELDNGDAHDGSIGEARHFFAGRASLRQGGIGLAALEAKNRP